VKNKDKKIEENLVGLAALEALGTNIPWRLHQLRNSLHERADARFIYKKFQIYPNKLFFDFKLKFL
jgi:hypothetical protein